MRSDNNLWNKYFCVNRPEEKLRIVGIKSLLSIYCYFFSDLFFIYVVVVKTYCFVSALLHGVESLLYLSACGRYFSVKYTSLFVYVLAHGTLHRYLSGAT